MIKAALNNVPQTLLLPLIARAEVSKWKHSELVDQKAIDLSDAIDYDKRKLKRNIQEVGLLGLAIRAKKFDAAIVEFIKTHPKAKILSIGAGLDTTFYRINNDSIKWFDLDLEESMAMRKQLLPPPNGVTYITKSMLDYTWIDDIGDISGGLFIQIAGVLPYFKEEAVKEFLSTIAAKLKGAEIIFDACSPLTQVMISQRIRQSGMKNARIQWGITDIEKIGRWSKNIKIIKSEPIFKDVKKQWSYQLITNFLMQAGDFLKSAQIVQLQFV